jgi:hypothetical protein
VISALFGSFVLALESCCSTVETCFADGGFTLCKSFGNVSEEGHVLEAFEWDVIVPVV